MAKMKYWDGKNGPYEVEVQKSNVKQFKLDYQLTEDSEDSDDSEEVAPTTSTPTPKDVQTANNQFKGDAL